MEKSLNPVSIRSRKRIIKGLLSLMQTNQYGSITISQICLQAQVVRKTFYRHFKNKEAVLDEYISYLYIEYAGRLKELPLKSTYSITLTYFQFWEKYIPFLKLLDKNNLLLQVLKKYETFLPQLSLKFHCKDNLEAAFLDYTTAYSAGGYWKLLCKWIERDFKETPEELARIHIQVLRGLSALET